MENGKEEQTDRVVGRREGSLEQGYKTSDNYCFRLQCKAKRKLFIFYLRHYSPHLNMIERLWKEIKARWLQPKDCEDDQQLFYSAKLVLNAIGKDLSLNYKKINTI